jgi:hypothetical protein
MSPPGIHRVDYDTLIRMIHNLEAIPETVGRPISSTISDASPDEVERLGRLFGLNAVEARWAIWVHRWARDRIEISAETTESWP